MTTHYRIGPKIRVPRQLCLSMVSLALLVLVAAIAASPAAAHRSRRWMYPTAVQRAIGTPRYLPVCRGIGPARATNASNANPATWLFRHFQCELMDLWSPANQTAAGIVCVHTTSSSRLITNVQRKRCRF
jgi:hypothetical protein